MKGIPDHSSLVIPRLVCRDPAAELDFCVRTFGATVLNQRPGPDGKLAHALLTIGPEGRAQVQASMLMIEAVWPPLLSPAPALDAGSPVVIFVYVEDVDRTVERAVAGGAEVIEPAQDQFWGDRTAWIKDPSGHVWTVASRIEQTTPEERTERWDRILRDTEA